MSSTVGTVLDRIFRDYLTGPDDTPVQAALQGPMSDSQTTLTFAAEFAPEEVSAIGLATIVEVERELMRVTDIDEGSRTLTVVRGVFGTQAVTHPATALLVVAPKWTRQGVFDAVADQIVELYPYVYSVSSAICDPRDLMCDLQDSDAVGIIDARQMSAGNFHPVPAELLMLPDEFASGVGVQYEPLNMSHEVLVRYARKFPRPTIETDTLATLGVQESWIRILVFGALSDLLSSIDVDTATVKFITEALEAETVPLTAGVNLSISLARLRATLLQDARRRLLAQNSVLVAYRREL